MDVKISPKWKELVGDEFDKPYFAELDRKSTRLNSSHE